jgi:NAD/FAD-utilizing enzyme apparently involved in cell division
MGKVTDAAGIQFRMLNRSKGPAMFSPRAQCDRVQYSIEMRKLIEKEPLIDLRQDSVIGVRVENGAIKAVILRGRQEITAKAVGYRARIRNHGHSCFLCEIVIRSQFHTTYEPEA